MGKQNIPKNMLPGLFRSPRVRSGVSRGKFIANIPISNQIYDFHHANNCFSRM